MDEIRAILAGAYDAHGIDLWFSRPRVALGGRTPLEAIEDGDIDQVKQLALSLGGMQAT